jgi:hypothetical protein
LKARLQAAPACHGGIRCAGSALRIRLTAFAGRQVAEERQDLAALQGLAQDRLAGTVDGVELNDVLCHIKGDTGNLHGGLLLLRDWWFNVLPFWHLDAEEVGGVHSIGTPQRLTGFVVENPR